jgi:septal ring factor EnvC (AmiA/AmiB activator)
MRIARHLGPALVIAMLAAPLLAQQADRTPTDIVSDRAARRLRELHAEAERLASEERTVLGELRQLEIAREIAAQERGQAEGELENVTAALAALNGQVAALEQQEETELPVLRARIVSLYKLGGGRYARMLLSTAHLRDLAEASRMVAALARQDQDRIATHRQRIATLNASRAALEAQRSQLTELRAQAAQAQAANQTAIEARNSFVREIDARRDLNAQLAGELQAAQRQLQSTLATLGAASAPPSLPIGPFRGDLEWPVNGQVRQAFGASRPGRAAPSNGVDLAAAEGTPVTVVYDGTVAFADRFSGFGRLVIVDHGAQAFSLYGNLSTMSVAQGDPVQRGDTIGTVGVAPTGAAGLYFELRVDGRPVDPLQWLRAR